MIPIGPAPAHAAYVSGCTPAGSNYTVCFSDPLDETAGERRVIAAELGRAIDTTGPGDLIEVAMYTWTYDPLATKLAQAKGRKATVRVVMDSSTGSNESAYKILTGAGIPVTVCSNCLPRTSTDPGINHNKFVRIQYGSTNLLYKNQTFLAQTSMNFTYAQFKLYNDMIIVRNNAGLNAAYRDYHARLRAKSWTVGGVTWSDGDKLRHGDGLTRAWFSPRNSGDPYLTMLNNITACSSTHNRVWAAMAHYNNRADVINRLEYLHEVLGCDVRVIVQDLEDEKTIQGLGLASGRVKHSRTGDEIHNKFLVVDTKFETSASNEWRSFVVTGSHNWTKGANNDNDEAMIRVDDNAVVLKYQVAHEALFEARSCHWSNASTCG